MSRTSRLTLPAVAVLAACSDAPHPISPSARPSLAAEASAQWSVRQRTIQRNGHIYSIVAAADNAQSGKPPATFYVFMDGQIQSITSIVYKRPNGVWIPNRARTTVFVSGKPTHQVTLDAGTLAAAVDPILAQENLTSAAAGDGSGVTQASAVLQSSLVSSSADVTTWDASGDFYDQINAFIASAGSEYCTDTYCIYIES